MRLIACCLAAAVMPLPGCGFVVVHSAKKLYSEYTKEEREVDLALSRYRALLVRGDFDAAADMFDPVGAELSRDGRAPVVGRDAIRAFLKSSADRRIVEFTVTVTSTSASGAKASQQGTYRQKFVPPDGRSTVDEGAFEAEWSQQGKGNWLLRRMHTTTKVAGEG